jgi:preprotein translocase subunit SecA
MRLFGSERAMGMINRLGMPDDQPIAHKILSSSIETAQKNHEGNNFARRKNVLSYDDIMNQQRTIIYKQRRDVLDGIDMTDTARAMIDEVISAKVAECLNESDPSSWNFEELRNYFMGILTSKDDFRYGDGEEDSVSPDDIEEMLHDRAHLLMKKKEEMFGEKTMREIERVFLLESVDKQWMEHLDAMDDLKGSIGLNAYAQRNPISEYRIQSADMFDEMTAAIREETARKLLAVVPREHQEIKRVQVAKITNISSSGPAEPEKKKPVVKKADQKVGRNDPCPCGSGKKYKKCCGANQGNED